MSCHEMTCREFVEFLSDYLEGELPDDQAVVFEEHMRLCPPCIEFLESFQTTVRLGIDVCRCSESEPPPDVPERLVQAILEARRSSAKEDGIPDFTPSRHHLEQLWQPPSPCAVLSTSPIAGRT